MSGGGTAPEAGGKQQWFRFFAAAFVPLALICLWRSPLAASLRPAFELGMPWPALVKAWLPEAVLLGVIALFAQRSFVDVDPTKLSLGAALLYLVLWLVIWGLAVLAPGLVVAGPLAEQLAPLKDVVRIGGIFGAAVAGGLALADVGLYGAFDLALMLVGAMVGERSVPGMTQLATAGRFGQPERGNASWFKPLVLFGGLYWALSLVSAMLFDPGVAAIVEPVGSVVLIGLCADHFRRIRSH